MTLTNRRLFLACGAVALLAPFALADDKKDDKATTTGSWKKKDSDLILEFVDKATLKIQPHGDKVNLAIECSYTAGKDGVVKVKITDHAGKDEFKKKLKEVAPVGTEFTIKWAADGDKASVDELDGKGTEGLKTHLEGKYEKK